MDLGFTQRGTFFFISFYFIYLSFNLHTILSDWSLSSCIQFRGAAFMSPEGKWLCLFVDRVGKADAARRQDIVLSGAHIREEHCIFRSERNANGDGEVLLKSPHLFVMQTELEEYS